MNKRTSHFYKSKYYRNYYFINSNGSCEFKILRRTVIEKAIVCHGAKAVKLKNGQLKIQKCNFPFHVGLCENLR